MNITQLVEAVASGANPLQVIEVAIRQGLTEGKPSGISRAFDQPGKSAKGQSDHDREVRRGYREPGPAQTSYDVQRDRKNFLKVGTKVGAKFDSSRSYYDSKDVKSGGHEKYATNPGQTYAKLPPVLQRLVKKNVRAQAAQPPVADRRGPTAGMGGYKAYDTKHQAQAAVDFSPAKAFQYDVQSGVKIDPALNKRAKDHDAFKDGLNALVGRSSAGTHGSNAMRGTQHGKQVKTSGTSFYKKYSSITHVHHPEHGEIQLFSPDSAKDEPTIYHRPGGASRGKMHAWSSPEAQTLVSKVMRSGEGSQG